MESTAEVTGKPGGRILEFDSLRGVAAVLVLLNHASLTRPWFYYSGLAVNFFFVLSAFLITGIVIERMDDAGFLREFYRRRFLRIWPIYYLALVVLVAVNALAVRPPLPLAGWAYFATYFQYVHEYWNAETPAFLSPSWIGHTWTLAIEEQFYLIWPFLLLCVGRRRIAAVSAAVLIAALVARTYHVHPRLLLGQCDSLALGALLACLFAHPAWIQEKRRALTIGFAALAVACLAASLGYYFPRYKHLDWSSWPAMMLLVLNVSFGCVIGLVGLHAGRRALRPLRLPGLCHLGQISYGFYLYHVPVLSLTKWALPRVGLVSYRLFLLIEPIQPVLELVLAFAATLGVAALSWRYVEAPILALKDRRAPAATRRLTRDRGGAREVPRPPHSGEDVKAPAYARSPS